MTLSRSSIEIHHQRRVHRVRVARFGVWMNTLGVPRVRLESVESGWLGLESVFQYTRIRQSHGRYVVTRCDVRTTGLRSLMAAYGRLRLLTIDACYVLASDSSERSVLRYANILTC
jgi:hypothetical protein